MGDVINILLFILFIVFTVYSHVEIHVKKASLLCCLLGIFGVNLWAQPKEGNEGNNRPAYDNLKSLFHSKLQNWE